MANVRSWKYLVRWYNSSSRLDCFSKHLIINKMPQNTPIIPTGARTTIYLITKHLQKSSREQAMLPHEKAASAARPQGRKGFRGNVFPV